MRPFRALFGGAASEAVKRKDLSLTVSIGTAYDDNSVPDAPGDLPLEPALSSSRFSAVSGNLTFNWPGRTQVASTIGSSFQYGNGPSGFDSAATDARISVSREVRRGTTVAAHQSISYTPALLRSLLGPTGDPTAPPELSVPGFDQRISNTSAFVYATGASVSQRLWRRTDLQVSGLIRRTDFKRGSSSSDFSGFDFGSRIAHGLSRDASLRVGYTRREAEYTGAGQSPQHDLDFGLDYRRRHSQTRSTTFGFSGGVTLLDEPVATASGQELRREYRPIGRIFLTHQMRRTWQASGRVERSTRFVEFLPKPAATNSVGVDVGGFVSRRADLRASADYTRGDLLGASQSAFTTYNGSVRLRLALTHKTAIFAEYITYKYQFDRSVALPGAAASGLSRNGVRVGLSLWLPVWRD